MKKKFLISLAAGVCALGCAFGLTACNLFGGGGGGGGSNGNKSGCLTFGLGDENDYIVMDCDENAEGQINIPATFKNKPVTYINVGAFEDCASITGVTIPNSVTGIDFGAFDGCSNLTSITIPNSVTSIGAEAFGECTKLANITVPDSVISIGRRAFHDTLWYSNQEDGIVYAGKVAYAYKGSMPFNSEIPFTADTKAIADGAFYNMDSILQLTIPDGVKHIGEEAFAACNNLATITIPDSVTSIGRNAFKTTRWFNNEKEYESVVYLGKFLIAYTGTTVQRVNIKSGTKYIADGAFTSCHVGDVTMPEGLLTIGDSAFSSCSLGYVYLSSSITSIGKNAFNNCTSINLSYDGTKEQWNAVKKGKNWDRITGEYYTIHYSDGSMEHIDKN